MNRPPYERQRQDGVMRCALCDCALGERRFSHAGGLICEECSESIDGVTEAEPIAEMPDEDAPS